jgi:nicotinate dehydrogenase subunit A
MATLKVNGKTHEIKQPDSATLLYVLRNDLELNGAKYGCGLGQCGACTVLANGFPIRSCSKTLAEVAGQEITTLEGLGTIDKPHPLQKAFIDEQAGQCGYCGPGAIMTAAALLRHDKKPSEAKIRSALDENLCRCGSQNRIVRAVQRVVAQEG